MKNSNLEALTKLGQSVWYDNLSRDVLKSGALRQLIDAGVRGLTSNPTIFKKAIADSTDYDDAIRDLLAKGVTEADAVCETLMIEDVGAAADLLRPIYDESGGLDGCASIEVSPFLAHDTEGTLTAARRLWRTLNRPNVMIKVPATKEGIPAIQTLLSEGINVNITLIFSVGVHVDVMNAYLSALETRASKGSSVDRIASVASFFVSRVDSICESRIDTAVKAGTMTEADRDFFWGKVGIANSKVAYKKYQEVFSSSRFASLREKGAFVQRPLWASTGTKNPKFSPVMYVEALAGPETVNTMPPQTLDALMKGAQISNQLTHHVDEAERCLGELRKKGVPFEVLLEELQTQGVKLFADSFQELLDSVGEKIKKVGR